MESTLLFGITAVLALALLFLILGNPRPSTDKMTYIDSALVGLTVDARRSPYPWREAREDRREPVMEKRVTGRILAVCGHTRHGESTIYLYLEVNSFIVEALLEDARIVRTAGEMAQ